ncbi:MAG: protein kinase [Cyanobacteria bacterium P01_A01_bin.17]
MSSHPAHSARTLIAHAGFPQETCYQLTEILGEGGTGVTYRAQAEGLTQPVAIKILTLSGQENWDNIERFEREAKILAKLQHPGIPRYLDYFYVDTESDRTFCIVQQLAKGQSLAQRVEQGGRFSEQEAKQIAAQLLKILIYLHQQAPPVIHRDLKPQNIIVDARGKLFLVDFGAVQNAYYDTFMKSGTMVGTYGYMAPEQFRGQAMPGTDLYGLGATLLFLLTHRSPTDFPVEDLTLKVREHLKLSEDFGLWLEKLLEPDVEDRFATAETALTALHKGMPRPLTQGVKKTEAILIGVVALVALMTVNHFKFPILSHLGFTPREMFEQGINQGNVAVVEQFLDKGISPNSKAYNGNTLLHWAVSNGRPKVVDLLVERGAKLDEIYKPDGRTVLHVGVQHDQPEVAAVLLRRGALVNHRDYYGNTPLHKALLKDDVSLYFGMATTSHAPSKDIVTLLVAAGADLDAINDRGKTPRILATQKGLDHLLPSKSSTSSIKQ